MFISPTSLRDYAKEQGWTLQTEPAKDRIYAMTNPRFERRQLVFPMDSNAPDYAEATELVIEKLATMEGVTPEDVIKRLTEVADDAIAFGVAAQRIENDSLPLSFAGQMVTGTQQLLLASACTVLKPQAHHPRLGRTEAQQFLDAAKFRHTRPGSFVLNVSCPVHALDVQAPLLPFEVEAPFVRRATLTLRNALKNLATAIETDTLEALVETNRKGGLVSSNLCEALSLLEDETLKNSVEISIAWAASIPKPVNEPRVSVIRFHHDYFPRIEEVRRELRSQEQYVDDLFVGTIERLDGDMGPDGKREGEVILSILTSDGEQIRARANLTAEQYAKADKAHMTDGVFVEIGGRLHPGRQPRQLSHINDFELLVRRDKIQINSESSESRQ